MLINIFENMLSSMTIASDWYKCFIVKVLKTGDLVKNFVLRRPSFSAKHRFCSFALQEKFNIDSRFRHQLVVLRKGRR